MGELGTVLELAADEDEIEERAGRERTETGIGAGGSPFGIWLAGRNVPGNGP